MILVHLERSEALGIEFRLPAERVTIPYDTTDGSWVQFTYGSLCDQSGAEIVIFDEDANIWDYKNLPFSDIVIEWVNP